VSSDLLKYLIANLDDADVVVPRTEKGYEPLCAVYCKSCLSEIRNQIVSGKLKIIELYKKLKTKELFIDDSLNFFHPSLFHNINRREDLEKLGREE